MKTFRRVYLTVDEEVLQYLGLKLETVTAATLRQRLREAVQQLKAAKINLKLGS